MPCPLPCQNQRGVLPGPLASHRPQQDLGSRGLDKPQIAVRGWSGGCQHGQDDQRAGLRAGCGVCAGQAGYNETWLLQEWCSHGTLADAFLRGWLNSSPHSGDVDLARVLLTAC